MTHESHKENIIEKTCSALRDLAKLPFELVFHSSEDADEREEIIDAANAGAYGSSEEARKAYDQASKR